MSKSRRGMVTARDEAVGSLPGIIKGRRVPGKYIPFEIRVGASLTFYVEFEAQVLLCQIAAELCTSTAPRS